MQRINNWDLALVEWAESVRGQPYEWGVTDCATLVMDACAAMYGREMFPEVKRWTTCKTAVRRLKVVGSMEDVLIAKGAEEIQPNFLQGGDIAIELRDEVSRLGGAYVFVRPYFFTSTPEDGVLVLTRRQVIGLTTIYRLPQS